MLAKVFRFIARISVAMCCCLVCASAYAQVQSGSEIEEVITIGTRISKGRTAIDLPVPVDVINSDAMYRSGATEVGRGLQALVPSFNFSSSSVSDGTDSLRPATLRGLGPDQVLVLINGKRRHNSALIHVNTSVGRGTAGVDMNAIPFAAIKRIEVLRDGAAAQYGSDAIAGVINIVLKDDVDAGKIESSYGEAREGDGGTSVLSVNSGLSLGLDGFINVTGELRKRDRTNRSGLDGTRQYPLQDDGSFDPRESRFDRRTFRVGDADSEQYSFIINASAPLQNKNIRFYGDASYSQRENVSAGFYRTADDADNRNPVSPLTGAPQYEDGFLPLINTDIEDISLAFGVESILSDWQIDTSFQMGRNVFDFYISNSLNASLVAAFGSSPTEADSGGVQLDLATINLDVVREFSAFNLAFGTEYKIDHYILKPGDPLSYTNYAPGQSVPAGIQVFPGYKPENKVDESRNARSLYGDIEMEVLDDMLIDFALRYENYSDFGNTVNGKLAVRYDLTYFMTLRGSVSTGFRAPSMQQLYFNNISTQFTGPNSTPKERGTFRNDSQLAKDIGIPELRQEESVNYAAGVVLTPESNFVLTADYYQIFIDNRIVISGSVSEGLNPVLDQALAEAGAGEAQFFLNAVDTETKGFELVATYTTELFSGDWNFSLSADRTKTEIVALNPPLGVRGIPGISDVLFTEQDVSIIEEWQPEDRISLSSLYHRGKWELSLLLNRYGEYTIKDNCSSGNDCLSQTMEPEWITDVQFRYDINDRFYFKLGANNIFDVYPDKNTAGQSRSSPEGGLVDPVSGEFIVDSAGVFTYSRRSAPFGFNGAYYYLGLAYQW